MDTFSNWLCDCILNPVCEWLDKHLCDEAIIAWALRSRITYVLYSALLHVLAQRDEYHHWWLFSWHGSLMYNTNITLSFTTCSKHKYPRFSAVWRLSYHYNYMGRRVGITSDFDHYHWGIANWVWHNNMDDKYRADIMAERKALNWAQSTVW